MTAAQREKIQQLGFWDTDVANPGHDDITLWAMGCAEDLAQRYVAFRGIDWFESYGMTVGASWSLERVAKCQRDFPELGDPPARRTTLVAKREIEAVLREREPEYHPRQVPRNQRILGYADLLLHCVSEQLGASQVVSGREPPRWDVREVGFKIIIEVKSVLPTLGELMRQLNLYRQAHPNVVLVAPDERYAGLLREQGVLFVKYEAHSSHT